MCVRYGDDHARFVNQIIVVPADDEDTFCKSGDSGSLVVVSDRHGDETERRRPVGLHTASNHSEKELGGLPEICVASPIAPILKYFGDVVVDEPTENAGDCTIRARSLKPGPECELQPSMQQLVDFLDPPE